VTTEERWVVVGLTLLILFGSGIRWCEHRYTPKPLAPHLVVPDSTIALNVEHSEEEKEPAKDLNRASREELELLPGIGPVKADRIARWREEHGRFGSLEDLLEVHGIGPITVERLRGLVFAGVDTANEEGAKATGDDRQ
jgi:competence ComEA-like helix-hairpin-helix protein